jgi:UDP-N-acetylmuramyl pentapeptide phosphotransferase/UDP-N-acetylglucosamine-1-phosphate transferase
MFFLFFFLTLNYKKKIFLGDNGTYLLSLIFGLYFIKLYNDRIILNADEIFIVMLVPGLDLFRLFFERIFKGKNPFFPDRNHIHHLLKKMSYLKVNFILGLLNIIPYFLYKFMSQKYFIIITIIILYFFIIFYLKKNVKNI